MAEKKTVAPVRKTDGRPVVEKRIESFAFGKENYILMVVGVVVIALGFILMSGKEDIFNTTKLTVAPIVVCIGFVIEAVAIMRRPKDQ
jgi:hypothetical protein